MKGIRNKKYFYRFVRTVLVLIPFIVFNSQVRIQRGKYRCQKEIAKINETLNAPETLTESNIRVYQYIKERREKYMEKYASVSLTMSILIVLITFIFFYYANKRLTEISGESHLWV